jgi:hypothetical protein
MCVNVCVGVRLGQLVFERMGEASHAPALLANVVSLVMTCHLPLGYVVVAPLITRMTLIR